MRDLCLVRRERRAAENPRFLYILGLILNGNFGYSYRPETDLGSLGGYRFSFASFLP